MGLGVGLASCVAPVFIAECARQDLRAALVTFNVSAALSCTHHLDLRAVWEGRCHALQRRTAG